MTTTTHPPRLVVVEYRADPVDLADPGFDYLNTTGSSLVDGAWYDADAAYMLINLNGRFYEYCSVPRGVWSAFGTAASFGAFYNDEIKGLYSCN